MTRQDVFYAGGMLAAVVGVVVFLRLGNRDVRFCRAVFNDLVNGRQSVQNHIDWEHLKALGVDVGAAYTALPNEQGKTQYKQAFIANFSNGFRRAGGALQAFTNWRLQEQDGASRVVAVDYPSKHKTLLLSIPPAGKLRLEAIQWQ